MDTSRGETAADLLNDLPEPELERIIRDYGEERWAKRIAAFIVKARQEAPIVTTLQLVDIVKGAVPKAKWEERIHPATRTFQAVRIAVNRELENLEKGLRAALDRLKPGGRGVVISFHSLEDRIVKHIFREYATGCTCPRNFPVCACNNKPRVRVLTGRPVTATGQEMKPTRAHAAQNCGRSRNCDAGPGAREAGDRLMEVRVITEVNYGTGTGRLRQGRCPTPFQRHAAGYQPAGCIQISDDLHGPADGGFGLSCLVAIQAG